MGFGRTSAPCGGGLYHEGKWLRPGQPGLCGGNLCTAGACGLARRQNAGGGAGLGASGAPSPLPRLPLRSRSGSWRDSFPRIGYMGTTIADEGQWDSQPLHPGTTLQGHQVKKLESRFLLEIDIAHLHVVKTVETCRVNVRGDNFAFVYPDAYSSLAETIPVRMLQRDAHAL